MAVRKAPPLKVVGAGRPARKSPTTKPPPTVRAAAESGSRRDLLVAMRSRIATGIDSPNTPPRDLAALSRRLLEIAKEIEALDAAEKVDAVGEAAATPDAAWVVT
jgi:hypothetical protein